MTVLSRYLCGHALLRTVGALIALSALALLFDLLDAGDDLLDDGVEGVRDLLVYIVLRLPSLMSQMLPVACLTGGLISVTALLRYRELEALWGFGHSPYALMARLMPLMLVISFSQLLLDDQLVPPTVAELRMWQVGPFKGQLGGVAGNYLWMRDGRDILRLQTTPGNDDELVNLTIFRRDAEGMLEERWHADKARRSDDGWILENVIVAPLGRTNEHLETLAWHGTIDTGQLALLATPPRELSLRSLLTIVEADAFNLRPLQSYLVWLNARFALAVLAPLMLLLPFALAREAPRQQAWLAIHIPAVTIGFCFIVFGGLTTAVGETGLVNPVLAAWGPTLLLALIILALPYLRSGAGRALGHVAR